MALVGNRSVLHKSPGRFLNGGHAILRGNFGDRGQRNNAYEVLTKIAAIPNGHLAPSAWQLPRKPGGISSVNNATMIVNAYGAGAMGKNGNGSASITITMAGTGGLISSATGTAGITLSLTGGLFASKAAQGTATITLTPTGSINAIGHTGGAAGCVLVASWTPYAKGWLSGTTEDTGLTPSGIANAVWSAIAAQNNDAGTMGNKLNTVSSGGGSGGSGPSAEVIAAAVKNAIQAELDRIDVSISSRLSTSNYVALK